MFRIWPTYARKNFFMLLSFKTAGRLSVHMPLPLFLMDGLIEPLSLLASVGISRRIPLRLARYVPYLQALGISGVSVTDMWKSLRWRGAFTLVDVDYGSGRFSIRFV